MLPIAELFDRDKKKLGTTNIFIGEDRFNNIIILINKRRVLFTLTYDEEKPYFGITIDKKDFEKLIKNKSAKIKATHRDMLMVFQTVKFRELERGNVFVEPFGKGFITGHKFILKKFGGLKSIPHDVSLEVNYSTVDGRATITRIR